MCAKRIYISNCSTTISLACPALVTVLLAPSLSLSLSLWSISLHSLCHCPCFVICICTSNVAHWQSDNKSKLMCVHIHVTHPLHFPLPFSLATTPIQPPAQFQSPSHSICCVVFVVAFTGNLLHSNIMENISARRASRQVEARQVEARQVEWGTLTLALCPHISCRRRADHLTQFELHFRLY